MTTRIFRCALGVTVIRSARRPRAMSPCGGTLIGDFNFNNPSALTFGAI